MNENPYNPPKSKVDDEPDKTGVIETVILNFLRHWNGKANFSSAFFGYFILGNISLALSVALFVRGIRFLVGNPGANHFGNIFIWVWGGFLIISMKIILACAKNSNYAGFYYIVRGLIIVLIGIFIFSFLQIAYSYL